jgi:hypothetical protein
VGTANVGFRAPACLTFYCGAARDGTHCHTRQTPPIRTRLGSGNRSEDPEEITFLTRYSTHDDAACHLTWRVDLQIRTARCLVRPTGIRIMISCC